MEIIENNKININMNYMIDLLLILGSVSMIMLPIILIYQIFVNSKYYDKINNYLDEIAEHYKNQ